MLCVLDAKIQVLLHRCRSDICSSCGFLRNESFCLDQSLLYSLALFLAHLRSSPVCVSSSVSFASDVCILSTHQTKVNTFTDKDIEVFPKQAFRQRKRRKKRLWFFWLGGYLLVDSVAIGVSRRPNRPVLAGFLELQKGDSVGEFVDEGI